MRKVIIELVTLQGELGADLLQDRALYLPDTFPRDLEMVSDLGQRMRVMMDQTEPAFQDLPLPLIQNAQKLPHPVTFYYLPDKRIRVALLDIIENNK